MDKCDIGVIPASITFVLPASYFYVAACVVASFVGGIIIYKVQRAITVGKAARKKKARDELTEMFPGPWLYIRDQCMKLDNFSARTDLLEDWLQGRPNPPQLSLEAIHKFAKMVVFSRCGCEFTKVLEMLKLHQDRTPQLSSSQLPEEWYAFYLELLNYPTRDLFISKICGLTTDKSQQHPCCKIPLSSEQATLLANNLARNDKQIESYARDLVDFVKMSGESDTNSTCRCTRCMYCHYALEFDPHTNDYVKCSCKKDRVYCPGCDLECDNCECGS